MHKLESSFLGYSPGGAPPYPAVICTSVNAEIVHGIPGKRELVDGDILKLDFGVVFGGFHGDSALTIRVGEVSDECQRLIDTTLRSMYAGIGRMCPGNRLGDVGHAVQEVAEGEGYSVVRDPIHVHDLHATILHLLGIDHARLTYRFQGRDFRLTDVHGRVVTDILA